MGRRAYDAYGDFTPLDLEALLESVPPAEDTILHEVPAVTIDDEDEDGLLWLLDLEFGHGRRRDR